MDFYSWLIYSIVLLFSVLFAFLSEKTKHKKVFIFLSYIVVVVFCSIRYDVGWDYLGYVDAFGVIKYFGIYYFEFGYLILNKLFAFSSIGYIGVFTVMSVLTYYFLFKALLKDNILSAGLFFTFTFQFVFMANDQIRQGLAVAIFIFATKYIENKHYLKFIIVVSLITILIHTSSIFLLCAIIVSKINLKQYVWISLILMSYFLYLEGAFLNLGSVLLPYIPFYEKFLDNFRAEAEPTTHYLIVTFWVIISILIAIFSKYIKRKELENMYMFGAFLFPVFVDFHIFSRFVFYFTFLNIVLLGVLLNNQRLVGSIFVICAYFLFSIYALNNWGLSGGYPYKTVFFENLERY